MEEKNPTLNNRLHCALGTNAHNQGIKSWHERQSWLWRTGGWSQFVKENDSRRLLGKISLLPKDNNEQRNVMPKLINGLGEIYN